MRKCRTDVETPETIKELRTRLFEICKNYSADDCYVALADVIFCVLYDDKPTGGDAYVEFKEVIDRIEETLTGYSDPWRGGKGWGRG
jgi:hypothetical protein